MREGAEPVAIEAKLVKANLTTGNWEPLEHDSWVLTCAIPSSGTLITNVSNNITINNTKQCGFSVANIFNASAVDN
jgi:hypothetical protein